MEELLSGMLAKQLVFIHQQARGKID